MKTRVLASALASLVALAAQAADPVPHRFTAGTPAKAAEVNANFDAIVAQLQALVPVGTVLAYAGTTLPDPNVWCWCRGGEVSAAEYPALSAVIGTSHGRGAGLNTFKLPDYQGRFLRGVDNQMGRDPNAATREAMGDSGATGDAPGTIQGYATARPKAADFTTNDPGNHRHQSPTTNGQAGGGYEVGVGSYTGYDYGTQSGLTEVAGAHSHAVTGGGDAETRPVNAAVNWIIRCR